MSYIEELSAKVRKAEEVFVASTAVLIGDISIGRQSSVWFGAVIRGDRDSVTIGERTNIQDNCVVHEDPGFPVNIGNEVIIGHSAIIHGANIGDNTLVGIRATVLNGAKIGKWCIIGAHALVPEGMEVPDYSMVLGTPGKIVKTLSPEQVDRVKKNAETYVALAKKYLGSI